MIPEELITYCGTYYGHCSRLFEHSTLLNLAAALAELTDGHGFHHWMPEAVKAFNYTEFRKGLDFFSDPNSWLICRVGCRGGNGRPDCEIRQCCQERGLDLCFDCPEFPCDKVSSNKEMMARAEEYKKLGREEWLKSQAEKAKHGYELHTRKYYRVSISQDPPERL